MFREPGSTASTLSPSSSVWRSARALAEARAALVQCSNAVAVKGLRCTTPLQEVRMHSTRSGEARPLPETASRDHTGPCSLGLRRESHHPCFVRLQLRFIHSKGSPFQLLCLGSSGLSTLRIQPVQARHIASGFSEGPARKKHSKAKG